MQPTGTIKCQRLSQNSKKTGYVSDKQKMLEFDYMWVFDITWISPGFHLEKHFEASFAVSPPLHQKGKTRLRCRP